MSFDDDGSDLFEEGPPSVDQLLERLGEVSGRLYEINHALRHKHRGFFERNKLMALSDDINGVTSSLADVASQFPPAVSSALSTAFADGAASGGSSDQALPGAVSNLVSQASTTVSALQSSLAPSASTSLSSSLSDVSSSLSAGQ